MTITYSKNQQISLLLLLFLLKLNQILSPQHGIMWTKFSPFISEESESLRSFDLQQNILAKPLGLEHTGPQGNVLQANFHHPLDWLPVSPSKAYYTFFCFSVCGSCPHLPPSHSSAFTQTTLSHLSSPSEARSFLMKPFSINPDEVRDCPPSKQHDTYLLHNTPHTCFCWLSPLLQNYNPMRAGHSARHLFLNWLDIYWTFTMVKPCVGC